MSQGVCMVSMPDRTRKLTPSRMFRISSQSTLTSSTFALPDLPNMNATIMNANKADPPLNFDGLGSFPFYMKLIQLLIAIICAGLHSEGILVIWDSTEGQLLPYIVCSVYMIINTVVIISYVLGQKMPELSIQIFGMMGCILFAISGAVSLSSLGGYDPSVVEEYTSPMKEKMMRAPNKLMAEGFLALFNSVLYLIDTFYSIQKTRVNYSLGD